MESRIVKIGRFGREFSRAVPVVASDKKNTSLDYYAVQNLLGLSRLKNISVGFRFRKKRMCGINGSHKLRNRKGSSVDQTVTKWAPQ